MLEFGGCRLRDQEVRGSGWAAPEASPGPGGRIEWLPPTPTPTLREEVMRPSRTRLCKVQCHVVCCANSNITPTRCFRTTERSANPKVLIAGPVGMKRPGGDPLPTGLTVRRMELVNSAEVGVWDQRSCQERNGSSQESPETWERH